MDKKKGKKHSSKSDQGGGVGIGHH
jgi:hypothetical protein